MTGQIPTQDNVPKKEMAKSNPRANWLRIIKMITQSSIRISKSHKSYFYHLPIENKWYSFVTNQWSKAALSNPNDKKSPRVRVFYKNSVSVWKEREKKRWIRRRSFGRDEQEENKEVENDKTGGEKGERNEEKQSFGLYPNNQNPKTWLVVVPEAMKATSLQKYVVSGFGFYQDSNLFYPVRNECKGVGNQIPFIKPYIQISDSFWNAVLLFSLFSSDVGWHYSHTKSLPVLFWAWVSV